MSEWPWLPRTNAVFCRSPDHFLQIRDKPTEQVAICINRTCGGQGGLLRMAQPKSLLKA